MDKCTNNKIKLMAFKSFLMLDVGKGVQKLQVVGDSKVVIDWLKEVCALGNFPLRLIFEELLNIKKKCY